MLKNQFVDQDTPLLPAGGYSNPVAYFLPRLERMFNPEDHRMTIGEISRATISQKKVFRTAAVITDQYLSTLNRSYLNYLRGRAIDCTSFLMQHRALTLNHVELKIDNPSIFLNSLVPVWKRDESDGSLLIYALDVNRQENYLNHLSQLLYSTNLITFATPEQIGELPPRRTLSDPQVQHLLDNILVHINSYDFFRALSIDLSTSWVDTHLMIATLGVQPLDHVFRVMNVLLWYCFFPSIARDCTTKLMYELFTALEVLTTRSSQYITAVGFTDIRARRAIIQEYPKERYLRGEFTYPILTIRPGAHYGWLVDLHDVLTERDGSAIVLTMDCDQIQTPRMDDVRSYFQPYANESAIGHDIVDGENGNVCAIRIQKCLTILKSIMQEYKQKYHDYTSKSSFGATNVSMGSLMAYFNSYSNSIVYGIGIRHHICITIPGR